MRPVGVEKRHLQKEHSRRTGHRQVVKAVHRHALLACTLHLALVSSARTCEPAVSWLRINITILDKRCRWRTSYVFVEEDLWVCCPLPLKTPLHRRNVAKRCRLIRHFDATILQRYIYSVTIQRMLTNLSNGLLQTFVSCFRRKFRETATFIPYLVRYCGHSNLENAFRTWCR